MSYRLWVVNTSCLCHIYTAYWWWGSEFILRLNFHRPLLFVNWLKHKILICNVNKIRPLQVRSSSRNQRGRHTMKLIMRNACSPHDRCPHVPCWRMKFQHRSHQTPLELSQQIRGQFSWREQEPAPNRSSTWRWWPTHCTFDCRMHSKCWIIIICHWLSRCCHVSMCLPPVSWMHNLIPF